MPDDPAADEPWPEEPDAWEEADRRWAAKGADEPEEDEASEEPPVALPRSGPLPPPPNAAEAYGEGMREAGPYLGLGLQIAGAMALFTGGGYLLDRALGTSPWGIVVGAALALVAILALVVRLSNEATAEARRRRAARGPEAGRGGGA